MEVKEEGELEGKNSQKNQPQVGEEEGYCQPFNWKFDFGEFLLACKNKNSIPEKKEPKEEKRKS